MAQQDVHSGLCILMVNHFDMLFFHIYFQRLASYSVLILSHKKNNMTKKKKDATTYLTSSIDILVIILSKPKQKSMDLFLLSNFR